MTANSDTLSDEEIENLITIERGTINLAVKLQLPFLGQKTVIDIIRGLEELKKLRNGIKKIEYGRNVRCWNDIELETINWCLQQFKEDTR